MIILEWTGLNDLREQFLSFFETKAHLRMDSAPLVPQGDNSLLLINSGMAPLKKYFLGLETAPRNRVTTCQKCIRTPDIENVGKTARHGTFFEMLGNFSFGDYFKEEATAWAWEFCTEVIKLPVDRLWVSIYEDDDETFDIWVNKVGVDPSHIVRLGKEDNFWEIGAGPCGPCSEIYFDRGVEKGCGSPDCAVGCECDRFVEFWNLVFSQFDNDGEGNYTPLAHKNIDTGMGLERLACICQGVDNLFEVDTVQNIMKHIARIAGVNYGDDAQTDISLRVVTDHIRSTVFMVADGVQPSNEGRGYVLRRLLRRAARHGRLLGIKGAFLHEVCDTVIGENLTAYPYLESRATYIKNIIANEEASFEKTLDKGMDLLNSLIEKIENSDGEKMLAAEDAFKLYDTFGFPLDLVREIIEVKGIGLDEAKFAELMNEQRVRARQARIQNMGDVAWDEDVTSTLEAPLTEFVGYETLENEASVVCIIADGKIVESAAEGDKVTLVLDKTAFYAESGGQVSDIGTICGEGVALDVTRCSKASTGYLLHDCVVKSGTLNTGDTVSCHVDAKVRNATARNHTSAHLLQAALREVLGDHVHQAGQLVDSNRVRFDFSHFSAMTAEEIAKVEELVNDQIMKASVVDVKTMAIEEAQKLGAMALFGEKYGNEVRVVKVDDFSMELCGGTHVANVGQIGLFKIVSESSAAAGVRRIEAVTGTGVLELVNNLTATLDKTAKTLKASNRNEVVEKAEQVMNELKETAKTVEKLNSKLAAGEIDSLVKGAVTVGSVRLITACLKGVDSKSLRSMGDKARDFGADVVAVLATAEGDKGTVCVAAGKDAVAAGVHAGNLVREVAKLAGGSGGGRPDSAMAGVKDVAKIESALAETAKLVEGMLK